MKVEAPEFKESIAEAVREYAGKKQDEGVKSLSRMNPDKVGLILYLSCLLASWHIALGKSFLNTL